MEDDIKQEADFTLAKNYKGRDLNPDIDVQEYINGIDPDCAVYPYVCPKCGRPYKDEVMLEVHLDSFDHNNPPDDYDPCDLHWKPKKRVERLKDELERESRDSGSETGNNGPSTPKQNARTPGRGPGSHKRRKTTPWSRKRKANFRRGSDVSDTPRTKTRVRVDENGRITTDNLTWAEAQRLVEFEDDNTNKIYRVSIFEDVEVVKSDGTDLPPLQKGPRVPVPETIVEEVDVPKLQNRKISSEYIEYKAAPTENAIEYQMDEEDHVMLEHINELRESDNLKPLSCETFEKFIDAIEKESMWDTGNKPRTSTRDIDDEDVVCCVCNDGECTNTNAILFCDLCNLAVHQECYGVPYIPEGQWLCRRCQFSPSRAVDCVLCPSLNGAFKQTHDNRWCHVVCALWVPEVSFQNPVFLEPIDGFSKVPKARWNLKCYICKKAGACIQCNKNACYTAFHVTCAQQTGLYMEMKVQKSDGINGITSNKVTQTAFCHSHTPKDWSPRPLKSSEKLPKIKNRADQFQAKVDETREAMEGRNTTRICVNIPYIPSDKLGVLRAILSESVTTKVSPLFKQLLTFWNEKRMVRNGVPLIRRLLSVQKTEKDNHATEDDKKKVKEQLRVWQRLRHDLERARLLVEQIKKRERLKAAEIQKWIQLSRVRINPWAYFLKDIVEKLKELDDQSIFYNPVTDDIAPLYSKIITSPMAFATMEQKIAQSKYNCFSAFEYDVSLILRNCMHYNGSATIFYKIAKDLETKIQPMLREARKLAKRYNTVTGNHLLPGEKFDQKEPEVAHVRSILADLRKCLRKAQKNSNTKHSKKTVQKLTADIKIFERRLRTMGVDEFETAPVVKKQPKIEEVEDNDEEAEEKAEPDTEEPEPTTDAGCEEEETQKPETNGEVGESDSDAKEEDEPSATLENGESSTPLTEVHENGQEPPEEKEPALKKDFVNGTSKESTDSEMNGFIEEDDSNDSKEEIKSSNKKIDLRNFQPLDTGYPWYPARIINPELTTGEPLLLGDEEIPQPSVDIIKAGNKLNLEGESQHHLVLFFDQKRTWMWLPTNKIALLGKDNKFDNSKLREGKTNAQKKSIMRAYKCALEPLSPD